jgi:NAD(P) transhydrogenase subunit alpha
MRTHAIWLSLVLVLLSSSATAQAGQGVAASLGGGMGLMGLFTLFVLACFVGFEIIAKVPPTLHTPLMSGSNAMSGITIVGALMLSNLEGGDMVVAGISFDIAALLGMLALICATINVVGGFLVTDRMLNMFKKGS